MKIDEKSKSHILVQHKPKTTYTSECPNNVKERYQDQSSHRAVHERNMPQEFHPGIFKSWNITKRTVFFSTSIGPININWRSVMSIGKRMTEKKENKKGKKKTKENHVSLNPILVAHWSWAPLIFTFVYFGISISQLDCNITL